MTTFEFEVTADPRKHGQPYVASLFLDKEGKLQREFHQLERVWGKRVVTVFGSFQAQDGELIEARKSDGSWKNDDRVIWLIWHGRRVVVADPDRSADMPNVHRYLATQHIPHAWDEAICEAAAAGRKVGRDYLNRIDYMIYAGDPVPYPEAI